MSLLAQDQSYTRLKSKGDALNMALPSTIQRFHIDLSDVDRNVYESIELRTAKHPSETDLYLVTRIIACCLHHEDGATMSRAGLCDPDEPPVLVRALTGRLTHWIDIGLPAGPRLHKASKAADTVAVYSHKDPSVHLETLSKANIHRAEDIDFYSLPHEFLDSVSQRLGRNNQWTLVRTEGELFVTIGEETMQGALTPHSLG